jgi:hypothetical protein
MFLVVFSCATQFSESNSYAGVDYVTASCLGLCTQIDNDPATTNDVNIAGFFEYVSSL